MSRRTAIQMDKEQKDFSKISGSWSENSVWKKIGLFEDIQEHGFSAQHFQKILESAFQKKIRFMQKIDPTIKGGISLRAGDDLYDATLSGRIGRLRRELTADMF